MYFASDNAGPAHPSVMQAMLAANTGYAMGYGNDDLTQAASQAVRDVFEAPDAAVYFVATGTAANVILLGTMAQPWDSIFCTPMSHINMDECNAPEFYSGAKLAEVPTIDAKMTPDALRRAISEKGHLGVHSSQRGPVSITNVTERGTVYSVDEIRALTDVAREFGLKTHLDGARFANAMVANGCSAAEMSWKAGVDAVSFGGTKNGLIAAEACVIFDPDLAWEFQLRRKRGGHLFSKHRYLAAQFQAYLTDDLWVDMARAANAAGARLTAGMKASDRVALPFTPQANMLFFEAPRALHKRMLDGGAVYYVEDGDPHAGPAEEVLTGRLVTDWSTTDAGVDQFLALLGA